MSRIFRQKNILKIFFFSKLSPWKTLQFHRIVRGIAWSGYDGIFHPQPFVMENRWRNGRFLICLIFPGVELENAWLAILVNFFHCTGISNLEKCTIFDVVVSLCSSLTRGGQFNGIQFFSLLYPVFIGVKNCPAEEHFEDFFNDFFHESNSSYFALCAALHGSGWMAFAIHSLLWWKTGE